MLSSLPSIAPCLNGSRTSFALHLSKPPTTGTRHLLPRLTNVTGKIAAKTQHPGPLGMPPVTPTGRPEQPTAFDPQSPPTLRPIFLGPRNYQYQSTPGTMSTCQLNAADLHKTPEPLDVNLNDHDNIPDPTDNQEALCANRIWNSPWIDVLEETQEKRWKEGAQLLVTQLPPSTPIMLRLPWLQDVNPNIDWKNLTMQFPGPKASLAAAIPLCLQSILDSNVSYPSASTSGAAQTPSTSNGNPNREGSATLPRSPSIKL
ncbi:hypothetical protein E4T56_gene456 [Termitomyces sp. T112]|nr:hypothetical protein E4T56_gene456 [Termitomyces sp. T112]